MSSLTIELNIDPLLMTNIGSDKVRALAVFCAKKTAELLKWTSEDATTLGHINFLEGTTNLTVSPTGDDKLIPNYDVNIHRCNELYWPYSRKGTVVGINGYAYTLAQAMAFPKRSCMPQSKAILKAISRIETPTITVTLLDHEGGFWPSDITGMHPITTAVTDYHHTPLPIVEYAQMPLCGVYYSKFRESLIKATDLLYSKLELGTSFAMIDPSMDINDELDTRDLVEALQIAVDRYRAPKRPI